MRRRFSPGLRVSLLLVVFLAAVPPLGLNLYAGLDRRERATEEIQENARLLVRLAAANQARAIEGARQLLPALAEAVKEHTHDTARCNALLANLLKQYSQYLNLGVLAPNGDVICSAVPFSGRVNAADRPWFQRAVDTRDFAIGEYQIGRITGKASLNFGYPIIDRTRDVDGSGQIRAVVSAAMGLDWLHRLAADAQLPEGAALTVLDGKGTILARYPEPQKWAGRPFPDAPIVKTILTVRGEGEVEAAGVDGVRRFYAFTPLGGGFGSGEAFMAIGIPSESVFAEVNRAINLIFAGLFIAVLALVAAWVVVDRSILRPVNRLVSATRRLSAGDLSARTGEPDRHGELGHLAHAFDEMAAALQTRAVEAEQAQEALQEHAARLEDRVAERTAKLNEAKQEADRANHAKSDFLSRMSHELRTPLNAILGFAQILEMDSLEPEQRESVEDILKGGRHLLELINEVLDIARIEAGRLAISLEPVAVQGIVEEALDLTRPLASQMDIRVNDEPTGPVERHLMADRQRLKQVLLNLLANGIKYNRRGGTVSLSYQEVPGDRFRIVVTDTGLGIRPEQLERLFTPFERLGAEQTGVEGTGLGLALSKRLVEAMGGTLGVESTVGQGSTFWVELASVESPVQQLDRQGRDVPGTVHPVSRSGRILLIEDNLSNVKVIQRLLAHRLELELIPAMQGRLGLALARQHRPHVILLDLHLPDIPGLEVLRQLRSDPETAEIPVVVISADATAGQIERLLNAGARAYLTKPLEVKKLFEQLEEILGEQPPTSVPVT